LKAGQTLLVNGAGGAVGGYAVQLAHRAGAVVTATASARSAARVSGYGADRVIDYTAAPITEAAGGPFDVVLNLATTLPEETAHLVGLVRDGGVLVSTTTPAPEDLARGVRTVSVFARSDAGQLAELVARVDAGTLHVHVADRVALTELPTVHARSDAGTLLGKTVVTP
jgi:NADPH:quinone reductase-like Zn-dependent oxidoreductase